MQWLFGNKSVAQELSDQVKQSVITQFNLGAPEVDKMRFSSKKGRYVNRPVKYIRIFDPVLIQAGESAALNYDAFAPTGNRRSALLFEGHVEKINDQNMVFLSDRRAA